MTSLLYLPEKTKKCSYSGIKKILENLADSNEDAGVLMRTINEYRDDQDVSYLREHLANNLKHRANIQVEGLQDLRLIGFKIQSKDGSESFNSKWIKPILIDIDETIELVKRVHIKLVAYGSFVLDFINLDNLFKVNDEGNCMLNYIRKKSDYKRILIIKQ
jgi:hypothetical protein